MEDTSGYEEAPTGAAAILAGIKAFGIGKIIIILVILVAALWFFVLAPKAGSLTLRVSALDNPSEKIENVQIDLTPSGGKTITKFTGGSGSVVFDNVPAATELTLDLLEPPGYVVSGDLETSLTLKSAESKTMAVNLAQDVPLTVQVSTDEIMLGTECQTTLPVSVKNGGNAPFEVQLIGDGALKGLIDAPARVLSAGAQETLVVNLTAPSKKGQAAGKIRVQYTDAADAFSIEATDPEQLRLSPNTYSERVEANTPIKKQFTIENSGRSGEARDIQTSLSGDFEALGTRVTLSDDLPLKPKQTKIMTLELTAPSFPGKSVGVLIVSSACQRVQIPMELTVLEPR